jgi:hypothetical protein
MSGVIQKEVSVAANAVVDNLISGSAFEFAQVDQRVSIGLTQSATGLVATITSGSDLVLEESPVMILGTMPIIPDHMYYNDVQAKGDRLVIRIRNTTAGALTIRAVIQTANL